MDYVGPAYLKSNAARKTRLIGFDTSYEPKGYELKPAHKAELDLLAAFVSQTSSFSVWIVGYASKRGNSSANKTLSANRALSVETYLKSRNSLFGDPDCLALFDFRGDQGYIAPNDDNSADERAVEVHIFLNSPPPPPPPSLERQKPKPELPGGPRFTRWQVASPGGAFVAVVVGAGFNIFFIKNTKTKEMRGYIQPVAGVGGGLSLSGLGVAARIVQNILTGVQGSAPDFTDVTSPEPVTWEEVEGCLVRVSAASAGLVKGGGAAIITFSSSGVQYYGPSGQPLRKAIDLWQFTAVGEQWQLGVGASVVVGPLKRVAK